MYSNFKYLLASGTTFPIDTDDRCPRKRADVAVRAGDPVAVTPLTFVNN